MSKNTRSRLYVDQDVQRALLWQLFRHWALFVIVLAGMLLAIEALTGGPIRPIGEFASVLWTKHAPLFVVIGALFPVFAYDSIKLSHRFVGPILRLRHALRGAAEGESVPPLQFRASDFWQDMAGSFNTLLEQLNQVKGGTAPLEPTLAAPAADEPAREGRPVDGCSALGA